MKVLVDTSVWVDHLKNKNESLISLLQAGGVFTHEMVIGELACGSLKDREKFLTNMKALPSMPMLSSTAVHDFIESNSLYSKGIGWVDFHLLSSALGGNVLLWTLDGKLAGEARILGCEYKIEQKERS